ncbi:YwaF family protein [Lysinibacillus sp. NPDC048646]|uniref:YwaF family protein n=1 Tax=Lysinibacillus sp. NPDC048646 TaxID=3390574 RepID=UPI003CFFF2D3
MAREATQSLENGFRLFDWYHISWLLLTALGIFVMFQLYRKANQLQRKKIRIYWAFTIVFLEAIKNIVLILDNTFWNGSWPFHLCGLGIFIVLAHALVKGHYVDMLLYCLTMPGALMALLTPEWTNISAFSYLHFHSFLFHLLLFAYPMTMLVAQELQLSIRKIWQPIVFLCITVPPIYALNIVWGTNFMFLNQAPVGTPLIVLEQFVGEKHYIIGLIGLVILFWLILLGPIILWKKRPY